MLRTAKREPLARAPAAWAEVDLARQTATALQLEAVAVLDCQKVSRRTEEADRLRDLQGRMAKAQLLARRLREAEAEQRVLRNSSAAAEAGVFRAAPVAPCRMESVSLQEHQKGTVDRRGSVHWLQV